MGNMIPGEFVNSDLRPTEVTNSYWLVCRDKDIEDANPHGDAPGKWMMYFLKDILDEKWVAACKLYRERKLTGISSLKVSTAKGNSRSSDDSKGVIIFYCGPAHDEAAVMGYGKNLLAACPYVSDNGYMYYKSDAQTAQGTRATGQRRNSLYRIPTPKLDRSGSYAGGYHSSGRQDPSASTGGEITGAGTEKEHILSTEGKKRQGAMANEDSLSEDGSKKQKSG